MSLIKQNQKLKRGWAQKRTGGEQKPPENNAEKQDDMNWKERLKRTKTWTQRGKADQSCQEYDEARNDAKGGWQACTGARQLTKNWKGTKNSTVTNAKGKAQEDADKKCPYCDKPNYDAETELEQKDDKQRESKVQERVKNKADKDTGPKHVKVL